MRKKIKWGIIGLGKIANRFAQDLLLSDRAILYGVASRNAQKALKFSKEHRAIHAFDSYQQLIEDPLVDVIYIATPHSFHHENTIECLKQGKAVLCEKPLGLNITEVEAMIRKAESEKLFLMEALWTRFIPSTDQFLKLIGEGLIGELRTLKADFGFKAVPDPNGRLFNKALGGGALMDIGIYPLFLSLLCFGYPKKVKAKAKMNDSGIDLSCQISLEYDNGAKAELKASFEEDTPTEAILSGDRGDLILHSRFHHSKRISHFKNDQLQEVYKLPYEGNGYLYEIEEVNDCVSKGSLESKRLPHQLSLNLIKLLEELKAKIGLKYDGDS